MVMIAIAIMIVASIAIVAYPLFSTPSRRTPVLSTGLDVTLESLVVQRDSAYSAIKDLEFDHAMGKLSETDYKVMRAKYETRAVSILQQLDSAKPSVARHAPSPDVDELIERQVKQIRRRSNGSGEIPCPKCGAPRAESDAFCGKCGISLRGARCPECGTRSALGDMFCGHCGARIPGA